MENLQNYQLRMKQLHDLDKFAFIDTNGVVHTSRGTRNDVDQYGIDWEDLTEPSISIKKSEQQGQEGDHRGSGR